MATDKNINSGKIKENITTFTDSPHTLIYSDRIVICNSASPITLNLPSVATSEGFEYIIRNINTGLVTIDGNASETIEGASTFSLYARYTVIIYCNGTEWKVKNIFYNGVYQFDASISAPSYQEGLVFYDNQEKSLAVYTDVSGVRLNVGQENHVRCTNKTGVAITNGKAVYINGAQGNRPTIALAKADAFSTSNTVIGLVTQASIDNNGTGYVTTFGIVHDMDTSAFTAGDVLYLSSSTAGGLQNTLPTTGNHRIKVGICLYSHVSQGEVLVDVDIVPMFFGDVNGGNYSNFESDGTYVANGNATTWDDLMADAGKIKIVGVGITSNDVENAIQFLLSADLSDYVWVNYQIPHKWKAGSTIDPHIHFEQAENNMPNFLIKYRWQKNGDAKTTAWTNYICNTPIHTYVSGTLNQIAEGAGITPPVGYSLSDVLEIQIYRDNDNDSGLFAGVDPYTLDVNATSLDIHYQSDTLGSRTEYSK